MKGFILLEYLSTAATTMPQLENGARLMGKL